MSSDSTVPQGAMLQGVAADLMERNSLALLEKTYAELASKLANYKCPPGPGGTPNTMELFMETAGLREQLEGFQATAAALAGANRPAFQQRLTTLRGHLQQKIDETYARVKTTATTQPPGVTQSAAVASIPSVFAGLANLEPSNLVPTNLVKDQREQTSLAELEAVYREFCKTSDQVRTRRDAFGLSSAGLKAGYDAIASIDQRLARFEPVAQAWDRENRPAFRNRFTAVTQDVKSVMKIVAEMFQDSLATERKMTDIAWKSGQDTLGVMTHINDGWRTTFGLKKKT